MEKDFGSWFLHQQSDRVSPTLDASRAPFNLGQQNSIPAYMSHYPNMVPTNGTFPWVQSSGFPHSKAMQQIEPHGWFNFSPRFLQAFSSVPNTFLKEKIPTGPCENHEGVITPDKASSHDKKRFLVFDQSGDQTTLMFSSGIGTTPLQCLTSLGPKLGNAYDLNKSDLGTGKDTTHCPGPIMTDECNENHRDDSQSEMHEDTEELNALLYSDDDYDDYEDEEEASTGHSPITMAAYDKQEWNEESEEVASSAGPTKRMKLSSDGGYEFPLLADTATSVKPRRCFDCQDDAESSCADGKNQGLGESVPLSGNKRLRKDDIRETVSILQTVIPAGKGKDAIAILDDAISYLISLKHKAKALGIHAL